MNLDLAGWTVSLLALNQEETWESSTLRMVSKVAMTKKDICIISKENDRQEVGDMKKIIDV